MPTTEPQPSNPSNTPNGRRAEIGGWTADRLPILNVPHGDEAIAGSLMKLAKRGKLAGYQQNPEPGVLFLTDAQGTPWDQELLATTAPSGNKDAGSQTVSFSLRLRRKLPGLFAFALIISVWPGLPLTDSLMTTYFGFYESWTAGWFATWMWYLPLTVIPIPWMWIGWVRKTEATTLAHALEQIGKIADALGAEVANPPIRSAETDPADSDSASAA